MTREDVVQILKDIMTNPGYYGRMVKMDTILKYCVEHGKSPQMSIKFVQFIGMNELLLNEVFLDTLEMLKKEHAIYELWSKVNPLLQDSRRLLSIY